ncbi:MAG: hypothetical protein K0R54_276 [Clostridiaceae bacterium]|jgi:hypothetical protein|nr:hypothetical protein [Clostridiaceae bacterium]
MTSELNLKGTKSKGRLKSCLKKGFISFMLSFIVNFMIEQYRNPTSDFHLILNSFDVLLSKNSQMLDIFVTLCMTLFLITFVVLVVTTIYYFLSFVNNIRKRITE